MAMVGQALDIMTVMLPTMIFIAGMSDVVHFFSKYFEEIAVSSNYSETLEQLGGLPFDTAAVGVQRGRSDLTLSLLESFDGFNMSLLEEVVQFNRGSCAISNFPDEHDPAKDYIETISRDLAAAWREFAINVNNVLLSKGNISIPLPASAST